MKKSKIFDTGSSLPTATHSIDLKSPIGLKWVSIGGQSTTGRAVSNVMWLDDGIGQMQWFVLGAIFWSPAFGAVYMSERVWRKWSSPSVENGRVSSSSTIQEYLGYPVGDTLRRDTQNGIAEWSYFERGMIYVGPEGSSVVYGEIYVHYRELDGISGALGVPSSDERPAPGGGRVSHFTGGDIYHHARTGAREVHGAIRLRYGDMGGPAGALGYPRSDEESVRKGGRELGRFNRFESGGIYYSLATGAWDVYGAIWYDWLAIDGPTGKLGFPTSGQTETPSSGGRYNEFQHGIIVWHGSGSPYEGTYDITDLRLDLFEYDAGDNFNVQVHITATPDRVNHGRMPAGGEFSGGAKVFEPPLAMVDVDVVRANTVITVWLLAISENVVGKDDRLGTIAATYTVDNLWGLRDVEFKHHDGSFDARFRVLPKTSSNTTDADELFWPFENTSTFKLSWETYARTFRDVNEADKHIDLNPFDFSVHPWEIFFYEAFYNNLAQGGSCFGTCLEAIYARDKRSLFIEPVKTDPFNPYQPQHPGAKPATVLNPDVTGDRVVLDEINVKHGYQMGAGMIEWFLGKWTAGALHDPERAYRESYADFQSGNWPILTVSDKDKFSQDSGHVVIPYAWDPIPEHIGRSIPTQPLVIYVKNPNFPMKSQIDRHCRIEIDRLTWKFKFLFADKNEWTGSSTSGGRLLSIPYSELNARPVMPGYGVLQLVVDGVLLLLAGNGETEQITDGYGRTFFHYSEVSARKVTRSTLGPAKGINWDPITRIPNLMEIPTFGPLRATASKTVTAQTERRTIESLPELYYHRPGPPPKRADDTVTETSTFVGIGIQQRPGAVGDALAVAPQDAFHHQIRGTGRGKLRWTVIAPRMSVTVVATTETGVLDSIHLGGAGGHFQNVTVAFPNATKTRDVSLTVAGWRGDEREHHRSFVLEKLSLESGESLRAQLSDGGKELMLENVGPAKTFDLTLRIGLSAQPIATRANVALDASSVIRLRPTDWSSAALPTAPIHLDVLDQNRKIVASSLV